MRTKLGQTHLFRAEVLDLQTVKGCSSGKRHVRLTLLKDLAEVDFDPIKGCDHPSADASTEIDRELLTLTLRLMDRHSPCQDEGQLQIRSACGLGSDCVGS